MHSQFDFLGDSSDEETVAKIKKPFCKPRLVTSSILMIFSFDLDLI